MAKIKTITECEARAIAADEAAEHLMSNWTDDQRERSGAARIVLLLRSEAATWRSQAVRLRARRASSNGVASRVASYCLSLRWTGDCAAIWDFAVLPLMSFTALGLLLKMPVLTFSTAGLLMLLFLGVGLSAHAPLRPDGIVEAAMQRRTAEKERTNLARAGLTPERYLATFPEDMWIERAKAAHRLGVSFDGKRVL